MRKLVAGLAAVLALITPGSRLGAQTPARRPVRAVAVLAGGCYWGVESVFRHVRGVRSATSGFAIPAPAGSRSAAPVEAVRVVYDPARITYRQILDVFFSVHDPTQRDRQGPDIGAEYRSVVFAGNARQRALGLSVIDSLNAAHVYADAVVTEIAVLRSFRAAGDDQQDYAARHPADPYIRTYDVPKLERLRRRFPRLYRR